MWRVAGDVKWMWRTEMGLGEGQKIIFAPFIQELLREHGLGGTHLQEESQAGIKGC